METRANAVHREPWNKGKIVGQKAPFKIRGRVEGARRRQGGMAGAASRASQHLAELACRFAAVGSDRPVDAVHGVQPQRDGEPRCEEKCRRHRRCRRTEYGNGMDAPPSPSAVQALKEAGPDLADDGVGDMKKDVLVVKAASRLAGKRWLPMWLRPRKVP